MGLSLRREWVDPVLDTRPPLPALELVFEQWVFASERALRQLEELRARYPVFLHCLSMNIGSSEPLDRDYFDQVREFARRFAVDRISDHLSWRSAGGQWSLSLLPLPRTSEALCHVERRVDEAQTFLGGAIALENVSQYIPTPGDVPLAEFFNILHERCGTGIHLDLNNLIINERWLGESPDAFLRALEAEITCVHVAGHQDVPLPVDDHSSMPSSACMKLLEGVAPEVPVVLEWDRERPSLGDLLPAIAQEEADRVGQAAL
jgi:uncharacterized protein (UPF0276 family)